MINYQLYIGLNDKDEKKQIVNTELASKAINNYLQNNFNGSTVLAANGVYKHENGQRVTENTIIVNLLDVSENKVILLCEWLKKVLNQESILIQKSNVDVSFI